MSVLSLFRTLDVDRRLHLLVEGESLLNDGIAVVLFLIVAATVGLTVRADVPTIASAQDGDPLRGPHVLLDGGRRAGDRCAGGTHGERRHARDRRSPRRSRAHRHRRVGLVPRRGLRARVGRARLRRGGRRPRKRRRSPLDVPHHAHGGDRLLGVPCLLREHARLPARRPRARSRHALDPVRPDRARAGCGARRAGGGRHARVGRRAGQPPTRRHPAPLGARARVGRHPRERLDGARAGAPVRARVARVPGESRVRRRGRVAPAPGAHDEAARHAARSLGDGTRPTRSNARGPSG